MKTFERKDIFSWSNVEEAKAYIGKEGYFADSLKDLQESVSNNNFQTLFSIDLDPKTDVDSIFSTTEMDYKYALFIPADKVKEVEEPKKWRAFKDIEEFKKETGLDLSLIVHYRLTSCGNIVSTGYGVITDFCTSGDKTDYITIGDTSFNLNELFNYEYKDDNEWKPFGVEE